MSDLTGKTITIPADLSTLSRTGGAISPAQLRRNADYNDELAGCELPSSRFQRNLADEIERQHPPRMDEPVEFGAMVEAGTHVEGDSPRERRPLVCWNVVGVYPWTDDRGHVYRWSELVDPRPVGDESRTGATS